LKQDQGLHLRRLSSLKREKKEFSVFFLSNEHPASGCDIALNYETPRLAVQALITEQDIATVLDRRIAHYKELQRANGSSKLIEANKLIEAEPVEAEPEIEVKPPMPRIAGRRYRRF